MILFREQGKAGSSADATMHYTLEPHQTLTWADAVSALGKSGLGSLDVISDSTGMPTIVARAYNDGGELGTSGATVPGVDVRDAITSGEHALLLAPSDIARHRFNIGIRTLDSGATIRVTVYDADGATDLALRTELTFASNFFLQQAAAAFAGREVPSDASVVIEVLSGSAIVYGTTTDNLTNDPSVQIAQ